MVRTVMKIASANRFSAKVREAEPFGEGSDTDRQKIGHREIAGP